MAVHVVWYTREVATRTSRCSETTRTRPHRAPLRGAEKLRRVEEGLDLGRGLLLPGLELLLVPVDPDDGDLLLQARLDVVVVAGRDVHPPPLRADPPRALGEVGRVGLVGADLLGGDDEVEVVRDVAPGEAEELVVDVRDQPGL